MTAETSVHGSADGGAAHQLPVSGTLTCTGCGHGPRRDDIGILRWAGTDTPWNAVPPAIAAETAAAPDESSLTDRVTGWPESLQRRLLHPATGAPATLVALAPGAHVLDLGTGWGALAPALELAGATVVRADWTLTRLRFNTLMHPAAATPVHVEPHGALPWASGTFDAVFLDAGEVESRLGRPARDHLLTETRRLLAPTGTGIIGTRNAALETLESVLRRRMPAGGAGAVAAARSPWQRPVLTAAGLRPDRVVVAVPARDSWRALVPLDGLRGLRGTGGPGLRRRVREVLTRLGLGTLLVRHFYVLCRTSGSDVPAPYRLPAEAMLPSPTEDPPVTIALSDARVGVLGTDTFAKVPLSREQQVALLGELTKTTTARSTAFRDYVVAGEERSWGGVTAVTYPRVADRQTSAEDVSTMLLRALQRLDSSTVAPLRTTTCWQRLEGGRGAADANELGVEALRGLVLEQCGDMLVPVGPSHGDLHAGNVMVPASGELVLVDWNRFEARNPLVLDASYAALDQYRRETGRDTAAAFAALADDVLRSALADHARSLRGELDPVHAAAVSLLDRVVSYSLPRRRYKPWTLRPLKAAGAALMERVGLSD